MKPELPENLCTDETVGFIANRHHVTPQQLLRYFLLGRTSPEVLASTEETLSLEKNEIEILKGLFEAVKD